MRNSSRLAHLGLFLSVGASVAFDAKPVNKIYGYDNIRRYLQKMGRSKRRGKFDNRINRHTGQPHFHQREIARRLTKPGTSERKAAMAEIRVW